MLQQRLREHNYLGASSVHRVKEKEAIIMDYNQSSSTVDELLFLCGGISLLPNNPWIVLERVNFFLTSWFICLYSTLNILLTQLKVSSVR